MKIWPHETIRELLARAELEGTSRAMLSSRQDAERFRWAIYSFRRRHDFGHDLVITLNDNEVVITRRDPPEVMIVNDNQTSM